VPGGELIEHARPEGVVGRVADEDLRCGPGSPVLQRAGDLFDVGTAIHQANGLDATLDQFAGGGFADATAGTGYQGDLPFDFHDGLPLSSIRTQALRFAAVRRTT